MIDNAQRGISELQQGEMEMKNLRIKGWNMFFAFGLMFAALFAAAPSQSVQADEGGVKGHTFNVTFTKWVTSVPANPPSLAGVSMGGVVGGDVGEGSFAGQVLSDNLSVPGFWLAIARYGFYGSKHSFTAIVNVTENDTVGTATITGRVTEGWLKGATVFGEYTILDPCPIVTPENVFGTVCFQGTLHLILTPDQ